MTAVVLPFPLVRRRSFIDRQAIRAADLKYDAGERHIAYQLEIQAVAMRRKGVDERLIASELRCMERAIRSSLWTLRAKSTRE